MVIEHHAIMLIMHLCSTMGNQKKLHPSVLLLHSQYNSIGCRNTIYLATSTSRRYSCIQTAPTRQGLGTVTLTVVPVRGMH
jgi:hypothetical protein